MLEHIMIRWELFLIAVFSFIWSILRSCFILTLEMNLLMLCLLISSYWYLFCCTECWIHSASLSSYWVSWIIPFWWKICPPFQMSVKAFPPAAAGQLLVAPVTLPGVQPVRFVQMSMQLRDIDQAAKYIGAGAATVGVAGSGDEPRSKTSSCKSFASWNLLETWNPRDVVSLQFLCLHLRISECSAYNVFY